MKKYLILGLTMFALSACAAKTGGACDCRSSYSKESKMKKGDGACCQKKERKKAQRDGKASKKSDCGCD